ncbi:glyoxalase family protein [Thozetella sp. PMI_491]|nr:glyoxalase family protein [Thozetella sp. PMI_491]
MAISNKVILDRLSYVIYEHVDTPKFLEFSKDFGFEHTEHSSGSDVLLRGYSMDPYIYITRQAPEGQGGRFCGSGFRARTEEDFEQACNLQGAQVQDISSRPGGGRMVSLTDVNGFELQIIYGQQERAVPERGVSNVFHGRPNVNGAINKVRMGIFNRMGSGPAKIHKLGHFGYITDNYAQTVAWYTSRFNFKATDIVHTPGASSDELMSFFHLDLGEEYSDHHCLLIAKRPGSRRGTDVHHSSFEVEDLDTQMMGHQWLQEKGYKLMWGVGRHIMGSQIFDYWWDPTGFIIEHYADGDVVNKDTPTVRSAGTPAAIWGPPVPQKWD